MKKILVLIALLLTGYCQIRAAENVKYRAEYEIVFSYADWWNAEEAEGTIKWVKNEISEYITRYELNDINVSRVNKKEDINYFKMEMNFCYEDWEQVEETEEYVKIIFEISHFPCMIHMEIYMIDCEEEQDPELFYENCWYHGINKNEVPDVK
jgi:hypothetical protein